MPEDGDLVIAKALYHADAFTISVVPHPPQLVESTYSDAVDRARRFASLRGLVVWYTEDAGTHYVRLN